LKKIFSNQVEQIEMKNGSPCNILWLFNASKVNIESFSSRIGVDLNSGAYGEGYYFAASLKYPTKLNFNTQIYMKKFWKMFIHLIMIKYH